MASEKGQMGKGLTDQLVNLALETKYSDLPPDVAHAAKRVILDTIGCCVGAFATDTGRMVAGLKRRQGGRGEATLMVDGDRLPVTSISYAHSQLANLLDLDETLYHRTHHACAIVMPALAMAEMTGASGQEAIAAVALGFDIGARVGLSMPFYETTQEGAVRVVPVWGYSWAALGTVAAAGRLFGLSHQQMANALGIAYVTTPLHFQVHGRSLGVSGWGGRPMHKYAMYGAIAEAGVNAVLLAAEGFTGDTSILDPDRAFWRSFGGSPADWDFLIRDLGRRWFIGEASLKFYPVARPGSIPVDLFARLVRQEGLSGAEIDAVTVRVPPAQVVMSQYDNTSPPSQVGPMPAPFAFALLAAGIEPGLRWVSPETLRNPDNMAFARKVKSEVNQEWSSTILDQVKAEGSFRRIPIEMEVKARGRSFKGYAEYAKGDPWGPEPMTDEELASKFRRYTDGLIGHENAERAITEALSLDAASDVGKLIGALRR